MSRARQFAKNSFWLAASTAIVVLVGVVYRPVIARWLGPVDYGRYSFIQAFIGYFLIIGVFGFRQVITREIGVDHSAARAYLGSSRRLQAATVLIAIAAACGIALTLGKPHAVTRGIFVFSLSIGAVALTNLLEGTLVALQRSFFITISTLVGNVAKLSLGIWALASGYGLMGVIWTYVLTSAIATAMDWFFVRGTLKKEKQAEAEPGLERYILKEAYPFVILSWVSMLYSKNDVFILNLMRGDLATGLYSASYVFIDILMSVRTSIVTTAYPIVARIFRHGSGEDNGSLVEAYERLQKHMIMIFLPASILLMLFGKQVLYLVFGGKYLAGYETLRILVWMVPGEVSSMISGTFMSAIYRQKLNAAVAAVAMGVSIVLTILLVHRYGGVGAAIATTGSAVFNAILHYAILRRLIGPGNLLAMWGKPLICGLLMFVAGWAVPSGLWAYRLAAVVAVYPLAVALVRPYDAEDRRLVASVIRR